MSDQLSVRLAWVSVFAGIGVVLASAFGLSASELHRLGMDAGWSARWALLFPITIDVYALICTLSWLVLAPGEAERRRAAVHAVGAVGISVAGNAIEHLHQARVLPIGWPAIIAASTVPPVVMALAVHVAVAALSGVPPAADETADEPDESGSLPETPWNGVVWAELDEAAKLDYARQAACLLAECGRPVTGATLGRLLGVTDRTGRTYLRKLDAAPSASGPPELPAATRHT
jgi:hypothetical protein